MMSVFVRLVELQDSHEKEIEFNNPSRRYSSRTELFQKIPGCLFAYWLTPQMIDCFDSLKSVSAIANTKQGFKTGNNDRFLRLWFEVSSAKLSFDGYRSDKKWFPCNKGGVARKWFGNQDYIVNWENDGEEIKNNRDDKGKLLSRPQNLAFNFKKGMTWTSITSGALTMRYSGEEMMFESKGSGCFPNEDRNLYELLGYLNSCVALSFIKVLAPTLDYSEGAVSRIPYKEIQSEEIEKLVCENIEIAKEEWDDFEGSWGFEKHPLI